MTTPLKAIGVLALSSLAVACSSQPDNSLSSFAAQCKASVAPVTGEIFKRKAPELNSGRFLLSLIRRNLESLFFNS
jgi:hypothetical protein